VADDSAVIVCLGDMPTVSTTVITRLMQTYRSHPDAPGCQASDGTRRGNPVLWAPSCLSSLRQCVGDQGARALLRQYGEQVLAVDVSEKSVTDDIDTPEDYARVLSGRDA
jgi:molybdenum cofactor cytidylyltransferase